MVIDSHGHVVAPMEVYAYQAHLLASRGAPRQHMVRPNISDELLEETLKGQLDLLRSVGTDVQLVSPRPFHMMHSLKPEKIVREWTMFTNDIIARQAKLHPDVIVGVAALPQSPYTDLSACIEELERCVNELGFVGCLLNPDPMEGEGPTPPGLGDEFWYPLYEKLVELDVPALVHSASCSSPRESYTLHFINEESIAIVSLLESRVFEDFPTLKIIVPHGGGAIPYQIGRFKAWRYRDKDAEPFEVSVRKLYYDTCNYSKDSIELLLKVVGSDRVLFGTEKPGTGSVADPHTGKDMDDLKPVIESIEWLTQEDRNNIFWKNALAVYPRLRSHLKTE
ncbi:amidohydrolase family protein [Alicyclobacillus kakegawensis]|uniref:amidohydrolase family protein n=1 Tax=Alicyclobacillus kakegawensis TaxID=392012 RepID=UPI00082AAB1C|nr:amidohydrolase family protein [Alicyclobacillus kakegawensis]